MDDDTLNEAPEDDVRRKAKEYSLAATGDDQFINKKALPEVMQVKNFGLAGYSTKYKGLSKEDRTEKNHMVLPLDSGKGRRGGQRTGRR